MRIISAKSRIECLYGFLFDRALHMQIMLRHVQIRIPHHALDGREIHAQGLHLRHVGVTAGMGRQFPDAVKGTYILLEFIPLVST